LQITRNTRETRRGRAEWFTGDVYIDTIATPGDDSPIGAAAVHFTPGAPRAWHTHPHGQTIWAAEGVGLCQRQGGADAADDARRDSAGGRERQPGDLE
jgi:quercetin dioxygenase-like cupin family protein